MRRPRTAIVVLTAFQIAGLILLIARMPWLALGILAVSQGVFLYGTLAPNSRLFGRVVDRLNIGETGENGVWLTIDDGPDPRTTPDILKVLEERQARATFFLIGQWAAQHPDLVRDIQTAGHDIGNHTHTHPAGSFWCAGPGRAKREVGKCDAALKGITGREPTLFRSPAGHSNPFVRLAIATKGKTLIGWSARGFDGVSNPRRKVLERISRSLEPGAVILLHEGYAPDERAYSPADLLEDVLDRIEERGLNVIPGAIPPLH